LWSRRNGKKIIVETAFLYGHLEETIYMTKPVGYEEIIEVLRKDGVIGEDEDIDIEDKNVLELLKTIYGLVQAVREWYRKMSLTLINMGYQKCKNDPCLSYHNINLGESIFCLYVNDSFAVGKEDALNNMIVELQKEYVLKVDHDADEYLGCKIKKSKNGITVLSQPNLLKRLESQFLAKVKNLENHQSPNMAGYQVSRTIEDLKKLDELA